MLLRRLIILCLFLAAPSFRAQTPVPLDLRLRLLRAEDTRNYDDSVQALFTHTDARVRVAAALSAGRIGDGKAVVPLVELLQNDKDAAVRAMAAFALGEIESAAGADALIIKSSYQSRDEVAVRARAVEALGKIAAALPETEKDQKARFGTAILDALRFEAERRSAPAQEIILSGVTAALRARPEGAGAVVARFLGYSAPRVRADALNALARLRAKDNLEEVRELLKDSDPIVRANAARVLGAAEDKLAVDLLMNALTDNDLRVRVAAIRALGALKEPVGVAALLLNLGLTDITAYEPEIVEPPPMPKRSKRRGRNMPVSVPTIVGARIGTLSKPPTADGDTAPSAMPPEPFERSHTGEILEMLSALNSSYPTFPDEKVYKVIAGLDSVNPHAPEWHIAIAKTNPTFFLSNNPFRKGGDKGLQASALRNWPLLSGMAQGLGAIIVFKPTAQVDPKQVEEWRTAATQILRAMLDQPQFPPLARPEVLRAYASGKPSDLREVLLKNLLAKDVVVRATAADLLGDLPASEENTKALIDTLPVALKDSLNDAALSILETLAKQKNDKANDAIKSALGARDYLVRWRAIDLLKRNGAGDFSAQRYPMKSQFTEADYREALVLKSVRAVVETDKGSFTIQLRPDAAPLNVLSFVRLARRGYFNGIVWHRVVPNFVIQGGDPRGDGNGGPGYALRCEINQLEYERGAVGMALSGKDTGGSQWFVTHSPQPHLDGGYTVFGNVTQGMETVDKITRGDKIKRLRILVGR